MIMTKFTKITIIIIIMTFLMAINITVIIFQGVCDHGDTIKILIIKSSELPLNMALASSLLN